MARITFRQQDGGSQVVEIDAGRSVMQGAVDSAVPGILAECGGACACATCMVSIDPAWQDRLPAPGPMELSMLDGELGMRLSCQIAVTAELEGLVVLVPKAQY